jgi:hypothetical protein
MKLVKLSEICTFSRGLTYSKSDEVDFSNNVVLRANNIDLDSNSLNLEDLRYIKDSIQIKKEKIGKKYKSRSNLFIFSRALHAKLFQLIIKY